MRTKKMRHPTKRQSHRKTSSISSSESSPYLVATKKFPIITKPRMRKCYVNSPSARTKASSQDRSSADLSLRTTSSRIDSSKACSAQVHSSTSLQLSKTCTHSDLSNSWWVVCKDKETCR